MISFVPAGDLAVMVRFDPAVGVELGLRIRALDAAIGAEIAGITETVPSFEALLVYYDPAVIGYDALCAAIAACARRAAAAALPTARSVELPCCYRDPELGFDLDATAALLRLSVDELVRLHAGVDYLVCFIGFAPGQPYLIGMPPRLALPRLETPRTRTPAGSVGVGGTQCCVYSVESPGGFRVLGRTPLRLYDPDAREPVLLRAGDRVRFREIDRREYDRIAAAVAAGSHRPERA
jgi:KipI family sensor histidine kinase inhibitor